MDDTLENLIESYKNAPEIFQATRYWKGYEEKTRKEILKADINKLRSGAYPIFATFGFVESVYAYNNVPFHLRLAKKIIRKLFITNTHNLPYSLSLKDIREMAYRHCLLTGRYTNARPISDFEASSFGAPADLFKIKGKQYTMRLLSLYKRYCFAHKHIEIKGNEVIVELGSGSGHQIEVLKKLYPDLTILCFDLPVPLYLCEKYLTEVLGPEQIVGAKTILKQDLAHFNIEKGKVHFLGNWMIPVLKNQTFDIFWNAASFGEMEPDVVENYLSYVLGQCDWIFLLQARHGKERYASSGVENPINFEDYNQMLHGYELVEEQDAYEAHRRMAQSGGYFEAVWKKNKPSSEPK